MTESPGLTNNSNNTNDTSSISSFEVINTPSSTISFTEVQSPTNISSSEQDGFDQPMTNHEISGDSVEINNPTTPNNNNNSTTTEETNNNITPMETNESQIVDKPLEPELTQQEIDDLKIKVRRHNIVLGEKWCPTNIQWYHKWAEGYSRDELGPIDNTTLLQADNEMLRTGLMEGTHFILLPESIYNKLKAVYGGGPDIFRKVIKGPYASNVVDLKIPFQLQFCKSSELQRVIDGYALKSESVASVKERMCKLFGLVPSEVKIWDYYKSNKHAELKNLEYVSNSNLLEGQLILLEEKNADGTWPQSTSHSSFYNSYHNGNQRQGEKRPGITGLNNLGNTCFMNSALQCLSNTFPITKYFMNNKYEADLNKDNVLGCHGDLATEYAKLVKQIWEGTYTSVAPRALKEQVEKFAPQFAGYHQHDSQELLAFLLDGLHEDLNKVLKKPFIESKDYDGRADEIIAKEHWETHKARNNSVIVDWFQSQLKSKLVCPECGKVSITFDPFMYLSLPIPPNTRRQFDICLIRTNCKYENHEILTDSQSWGDTMSAYAKLVNIPQENLVFAVISNNSISKILKPEHTIDNISLRDIVIAYEIITSDPLNPSITYQQVKVTMRPINGGYYNSFKYPLVLSVPSNIETTEDLYKLILERVDPCVRNKEEIDKHFEENKEAYDRQQKEEEEEKQRRASKDIDQGGSSADDDNDDDRHRIHQYSHMNRHYDRYQPAGMGGRDYMMGNSYHYSNSYGGGGGSSGMNSRTNPDPRLIFQMIDISKKSQSTISFPFKSTEILLLWDENYEKYFDPDQTPFSKSPNHREIPIDQDFSLEKCIQGFITEEKLGADDPWYCNVCKKHQRATKKFDIWSAPPILVVHLKRFAYKRTIRDKIDMVVKFPLVDLDLSKYVLNKEQPTPIYDLYAVSNHFGSLGGGHYTAFALNEPEKTWYRFDDGHVSEANTNSIVSEAAYVLFYRRKDTLDPNFHLYQTISTIPTTNNNNNTTTQNGDSTTTTTTTTTTNEDNNMNSDDNSTNGNSSNGNNDNTNDNSSNSNSSSLM